MSFAELKSGHNSRTAKRGLTDLSSCKNSELHGSEKDKSHELISMLDSELKILSLSSESVDILNFCGQNQLMEEFYSQPYSAAEDSVKLDQQLKDYNPCVFSYKDRPLLMLQNVGLHKSPLKTDSRGFKDFDYYNHLDPGPTKLDSEWIGVEKAEPWWHTTDKELAAFGSPKSSGRIGNSEPSRRQCLGGESYNCSNRVSRAAKELVATCDCYLGHPSQSQHKRLCDGKGCSTHGSRRSLSGAKVVLIERSSDVNKGELLEALCHSQTRAREAEELAQQAFKEKEHMMKLFLRQACHLFAYRQWLQILQLQGVCLQLRNKNSPSVPSKGRKLKKKCIKRRKAKGKCKINKCVVALGLAGAGLLLGWTMGWLFPAL